MKCPQCQHVLRDDARFCDGCGISMSSFDTPTEFIDPGALEDILSPPDPLLGQVLDSKYELVARLGEGGMGAVYRARRVHIGDEVAVKVLHRSFVADGDAVERFRREARAAAMLRHRNVVTIHDFGEARGTAAPAYIVMELAEGASLRVLLRSVGRLSPARAVALMQDICAGVGAAHRRQIVHRDLKPDNIIILPPDVEGERETAKVVDFGIAKLRDRAALPTLTQAGTLIGTPYYMSPEQCRGDELDARSDVYSLGAVLYEMLAGVPPFTANSMTGVVTKHLTETPPPFPSDANIPRALEIVCLRALSKDVNARQPEATTLGRELQATLHAPVAQASAATTTPNASAAATAQPERATASQLQNASPSTRATGDAAVAVIASGETTQAEVASGARLAPHNDAQGFAAPSPAAAAPHAPPARKSSRWLWGIGGLAVLLGGGLVLGVVLIVYLAGSKATTSNINRPVNSRIASRPAKTTEQTRPEQKSAPGSEGLKGVLRGHSKDLRAVAFSPDGRLLATGSEDMSIKLWDAQTGQLKQTLSDLGSEVASVAFSPDGSMLAAALNYNSTQNNYSVIVVDAQGGKLGEVKQKLTYQSNPVSFLAFSADGKTLFGGSYRKLKLWDTGTWALRRENEMGEINPAYALSADGKLIATGGTNEKSVKVWDAESGALKLALDGHEKGVLALAFSPDGDTLVSGSYDNTARLWDAQSGAFKQALTEDSTNAVFSVAFSPDGRTIASGTYHEVKLWDAETGLLRRKLSEESMGITYRVAFSPDGKTLAGASDDTVKLWDVSGIR
ncbi:MAG TPA: protein kinase [Pyrinomonadaceae bacterium]|jgi:serine/threonine protein kinase|nr:protein kinase [Pyrinomonadaceae bacterium]